MPLDFALWQLVLMLVLSVIAGVLNSLSGGGGVLTMPTLIAFGMPAISANVTNAIALYPGAVSALWEERKAVFSQPETMRIVLPAVAGGVLGSMLLLHAGQDDFEAMAPWFILLATLIMLFQPHYEHYLKTRVLHHGHQHPKTRSRSQWLLGLASVYGGFYGVGQGLIYTAILTPRVAGDVRLATMLKQLVVVASRGFAIIVFLFSGHIYWEMVLFMAVGAAVGGRIGAQFQQRVDPTFMRKIMIALGFVAFFVILANYEQWFW